MNHDQIPAKEVQPGQLVSFQPLEGYPGLLCTIHVTGVDETVEGSYGLTTFHYPKVYRSPSEMPFSAVTVDSETPVSVIS